MEPIWYVCQRPAFFTSSQESYQIRLNTYYIVGGRDSAINNEQLIINNYPFFQEGDWRSRKFFDLSP